MEEEEEGGVSMVETGRAGMDMGADDEGQSLVERGAPPCDEGEGTVPAENIPSTSKRGKERERASLSSRCGP
jgi:hypothetical protein